MIFPQLSQLQLYTDPTTHYIYQHSITHRFLLRIVVAVSTLCCLQARVTLLQDAFTWWYQLADQGGDHELVTLEWLEFKLELVDALVDIDCKLKLC